MDQSPQMDQSSQMDKSPQTIESMFSGIAKTYDLVNRVISFGADRFWRKKLVNKTKVALGSSVLDCATGTGDVAFLYKYKVGKEGRVVGIDFCNEMLLIAVQKAKKKQLDVSFQRADVTKLPFEDRCFDAVSISFGIRNVEDRPRAFSEMARVTRSGGQVMILEVSLMHSPVKKKIFHFYSSKIMPGIGGLLSGKPKAYKYLNSSWETFPWGECLKKEIMDTGLYKDVISYPLGLGAIQIYECLVK